jgi:hypothetical protein
MLVDDRTNAEVDWGGFNSRSYTNHNYRTLRDDDRQILEIVRGFFGDLGQGDLSGLDIGSGSNLYPALAMLPLCRVINLREYAKPNVEWLGRQVRDGFNKRWSPFWSVLAEHPAYAKIEDPRVALSRVADVDQQNIFDLPERTWSIGTMFFVACSISNHIDEFERAVRAFVRSLTVGAPFAAAFMIDSAGYKVRRSWYPSARISADDVESSFTSIAYDVKVHPITTQSPLRPGYSGMLLVTGRSGS